MTIRLIVEAEFDEVAALAERAYSADYDLPPSYRASIVAVRGRAEEHQVWVARDAASGDLLGTVSTPHPGRTMTELPRAGEMDFRLLAVDPAARRRGIGEVLTRHVLALAVERGVTQVVMNSGPEMVGAHRLYERMGFVRLLDREPDFVMDDGRILKLLAFGANPRMIG